MSNRWSVEQVEAVAPSAASVSAAQPLASPTRWMGLGADDRMVWGSCSGSGAEPYETMVDHQFVGFSCTCPSRKTPCKHVLALLLLWVRGQVLAVPAPPRVEAWWTKRDVRQAADKKREADVPFPAATGPARPDDESDGSSGGSRSGGDGSDADGRDGDGGGQSDGDGAPTPEPPDDSDRDAARDDRVARMRAGLSELDRWLDDRIRTGLADPSLARYGTWDSLAARLVDAQAGSLANRIRRLAGLVGASPGWHSEVLAELGLLHLLSQAGRHLGSLPGPLADAVATTVGWQVRQADVLAGVPDTDDWIVAGRSDVREDRIEVRRHWLQGVKSGRWALVLSFAAYQQSLDTSLIVGTSVHADLHRYPGGALRALVGARHSSPVASVRPVAHSILEGCDELGHMLAAEPWLDRLPVTVHASLTRSASHSGTEMWALTDDTGSMPLLGDSGGSADVSLAMLLAVSEGRAVDLTVEWTPRGVVALAVHLDDRSIDVGPRANTSFVSEQRGAA